MSKKIVLFAPCAYNLAETTRMIEVARGVRNHPQAAAVFDIQFISEGGQFEALIEQAGFSIKKLEPRITQEKIDYAYKVDKGEVIGSAFTPDEFIEKIENEVAYLKQLQPVAVITGSYVTIPVTCRILGIPLVWVMQSTWLREFMANGAGVTDGIKFRPLKKLADGVMLLFIKFWMRIGLLNSLNKAARHFGAPEFKSVFEYWQGDINLVAEPAEFSGLQLPPNHYYTGPLIAREDFPIPPEVQRLPRDKPLIYFAMGSSGTPEIVAEIVESFAGKPYHVIAPVKNHLDKVPQVKIPPNVLVTDWLPAHKINQLADLSVIHGGVGTVMTAAYAGKPVVGIGMQPEQDANIACLVRKGFAIRIPKSKHPGQRVQAAIRKLLNDEQSLYKAQEFAQVMQKWDGPNMAAARLYETFGLQS